MTRRFSVMVMALGVVGMMATARPVAAGEDGVEAKVAFARLKTLAGEWKDSGGDEHHGPGSKSIYKVTAAGSAVMETQFPGSGHEMVTMYHLDGDQLLATHYCAAGNQPRLRFDRKGSKPDVFLFTFDGGTNFDPAKDTHIHSLKMTFLDGGRMESEWEAFENGKKAMTSKFAKCRP